MQDISIFYNGVVSITTPIFFNIEKRLTMKIKLLNILLFLIVILLAGCSTEKGTDVLHPKYLRCEYLINPLGIDEESPRLSWYSDTQERGQYQTAYQIIVASTAEKLNSNDGDLWDSKKVKSNNSINVIYQGKPLSTGLECFWKVRVWDKSDKISEWSKSAKWSMGLLNKFDWKGLWIGLDKAVGNDKSNENRTILSARMLRKEFKTTKKIRRATAYICGLGLFELYLNGEKIGDQVLAPGLSDYSKRSLYMTFDVTKNLVVGENAVGVILGNGRFFAPRRNDPAKTVNYGFPKMIFQLSIDYIDGTEQTIVSNKTWKITANGPITANNEYDGEIYDARKEILGWDKIGFNDSKWMNAEIVTNPSKILSAQMLEPIRIMQTLQPQSIKKIKPGVYIYDMGQNMVGWVSIKVRAKRGTKIKMRFAERLKPDGELYVANLRTAKQTDVYITKGKGLEKWEPRFTYHGFRFVELIGYPSKPTLNTIEGKVVYNSIRTVGRFSCSNDIVNKVYKAAYWGIRGNYRSIPTDCPQRDERQGWLGDRSINSYGESFIFDNNMLYENWMTNIANAQKSSGSIPDVAPPYWPVYSDNMTWPSSIIIISDNLYRQYGNIKVIKDNYSAMKKWLFYMRDKYMKNYLLPKDTYGDWCMPPKDPKLIHSQDSTRITPGDFIGSAYFYHCLKLMEKYAYLLKKNSDAKEYSDLSKKVRNAVNNNYLDKKMDYYANNTVTANALAVYFNIPPKEIIYKVFDNIVDRTANEYKNHTSCGLVGEQWIMQTLTDNGRPDIAFDFASNITYPSWGYMIENGATTIWELWNGNTGDPAMNSGNHVMLLGDLVVWLYQDLAGIESDPQEPGFKHIIMKPYLVGDLKFVNASYQSIFGPIKSEWHLMNSKFSWQIEIPANTTATIYIPAKSERDVTENAIQASKVKNIEFVKYESDRAIYKIGSGTYNFVSEF